LQRLAMAVETRDALTGDHVIRVGDLSAKIAAQYGIPSELVDRIKLAARLHDLGKIGIPDAILMKNDFLNADEFELMKSHTIKGATMLANSPMPLFRTAEEIALTHHERWDGSGYPHRLKGEDIPITGRIVAVADAFDAMTSQRPYKSAVPVAAAIAEIIRCSGTQFDPNVVQAFLHIIAPEVERQALSPVNASPKIPVPILSVGPTPYYWSVPLRTVNEPIYTASVSVFYK
jgi:response regulator RpfG family c-di-GMP phosphodiesterase